MKFTVIRDNEELYLVNFPVGENGAAVNITTALTADACERVRAQGRGKSCFEIDL